MEELVDSQEKPYELPEGWVWTSLGEISNRIKGKKPKVLGPKSDDLTVPYVDIEAFEKKVFKAYTDGKDCLICEPADILIVWDGARCGLVGGGVEGVIGSTLAKLVYYDFNSAYLFYFLQTQYDLINKNPRGVGIPHIEPIIFWNISFPLPPLNEQRRIVSRLEQLLAQVNAAKEHLAQVPSLMKQFRQSVLAAACSGELTKEWRKEHPVVEPASELLKRINEERMKRAKAEGRRKPKKPMKLEGQEVESDELTELPEGWTWTTVGLLSYNIQYGYTASSVEEPIGPKMLRITDIQNDSVDWETVPYCQISTEEEQKYLLNEGDLVFARTGATVGKSYLLKGKFPEAVFASYLIRLILSDHLQKEYVSYFFHSYFYWFQINKGQIGIGQPNVNSKTLSNIVIPLPPLPEQHAIAERLKDLFHFADEVEQRYQKAQAHLEKLTQSILAKAFRGELVPQDPNDEPASVLLERIKQERAKTTRKNKTVTLLDYYRGEDRKV